MNARELILADSINVSKGGESLLKKRQHLARVYAVMSYYRLFSLLAVPTFLFLAVTKRHTGRTIYRNLFLISPFAYIFFENIYQGLKRDIIKEYGCKADELNSQLFFYRYALLD